MKPCKLGVSSAGSDASADWHESGWMVRRAVNFGVAAHVLHVGGQLGVQIAEVDRRLLQHQAARVNVEGAAGAPIDPQMRHRHRRQHGMGNG